MEHSGFMRPGQRKLARYRHTQSCIRVAGYAPGHERELQKTRCNILAAITVIVLLTGVISVLF
jgi:hypothetical protein